MNAKFLSSLSAALIVTSLVSPAMAQQGIDPNTKLDWSAAIGTGHAAGTIETIASGWDLGCVGSC